MLIVLSFHSVVIIFQVMEDSTVLSVMMYRTVWNIGFDDLKTGFKNT